MAAKIDVGLANLTVLQQQHQQESSNGDVIKCGVGFH